MVRRERGKEREENKKWIWRIRVWDSCISEILSDLYTGNDFLEEEAGSQFCILLIQSLLMYYWSSFSSSSWGRPQFNSEKLVLTVRQEHVFFFTNGKFFCARRFFISFAQMNISVSVILDTSVHFCTPWDNHVHALRFATNSHAAQFLIESVSSKFTYMQNSIPSELQILDIKLKTRLLEQLWHRAADGKLVDLNLTLCQGYEHHPLIAKYTWHSLFLELNSSCFSTAWKISVWNFQLALSPTPMLTNNYCYVVHKSRKLSHPFSKCFRKISCMQQFVKFSETTRRYAISHHHHVLFFLKSWWNIIDEQLFWQHTRSYAHQQTPMYNSWTTLPSW